MLSRLFTSSSLGPSYLPFVHLQHISSRLGLQPGIKQISCPHGAHIPLGEEEQIICKQISKTVPCSIIHSSSLPP